MCASAVGFNHSKDKVAERSMREGIEWSREWRILRPRQDDLEQARAAQHLVLEILDQLQQAAVSTEPIPRFEEETATPYAEKTTGIRAKLRQWQQLHGDESVEPDIPRQEDYVPSDEPLNTSTRLPDESTVHRSLVGQADVEENVAFASSDFTSKEGYDGSGSDDAIQYVRPGDLVEIEFTGSERESIVAVHLRRLKAAGGFGQFLTMTGRWIHTREADVQYSVPGFVKPETLQSLLEYVPLPESMADIQELSERGFTEDLSIPRELAAPVVSKLLAFYEESLAIYRQSANALDAAHSILAHDTDLRYGSLMTAAKTLLQLSTEEVTEPALFAVHKALGHAGFAFNVDRRSHRVTGHMQIRSKGQVKSIETVRRWLREWQDDMAAQSVMTPAQRNKHKSLHGALVVHSFIRKAKTIVEKNRENRQPVSLGANVGPSKERLPIAPKQDCVKVETSLDFDDYEQQVIRFLETWSCTSMFKGLPRIESLPPLILQATELYPNQALGAELGYLFLQEIGTIMPYENRVRFDQHLLLPSSQHSKPLSNLMNSLLAMSDNPDFKDSMADLRHDWKDLPVYCVDDAGALEIDDGISIEQAGIDPDGRKQVWIHVHVANPTAFFDHLHPLAKMARHMGETIYMPERNYMMLPRWTTQNHFSLKANRPCLTFSAKLDADGTTIEHKVTPGIIRNVISITPGEVDGLLGLRGNSNELPLRTYSVGGQPPPPRPRTSAVADLNAANIQDLKTLMALAEKRAAGRKAAGGLFFDSHRPDLQVWQTWRQPGLAWDQIYRKGSRTVVGDPIIQLQTRGLFNWFAPSASTSDVLVRESMLLACEISASWCAERKLPAIFRGTVQNPAAPDRESFYRDHVLPAMKPDGEMPMWLGAQYVKSIGTTVLRTEPITHQMLGMPYYSKVTSPLRRYGDMVLHWQIEAALRHEAQTGEDLKVTKGNRPFLPFSKPMLRTLMIGLQPREKMITKTKQNALMHWSAMLFFRKHHFGEDGGFSGPEFGSEGGKTVFRIFVSSQPDFAVGRELCQATEMATNTSIMLKDPTLFGIKDQAKLGDIWEAHIDYVSVYQRGPIMKPLRLVAREGL
ncbi:hypothetical protein TI39_contig4199g00003 [Zymoseptoria brevis]|uniref:RNB domain-containing protein n=1 Tax=Zymoseptoria brevis TaxID=1047168 RepID=A0A0F4GAG8_9PEZI|nr:hypothetical protein TI39_contig4199g00003 [Zymoseptoria brevis]